MVCSGVDHVVETKVTFMKQADDIAGHRFKDAQPIHSHAYLLPSVDRTLLSHFQNNDPGTPKKVFDLGCGNGSVSAHLHQMGYQVVGVDPSNTGIEHAREAYPELELRLGSAYDDLETTYGKFDAVVSLEVVEHVYAPRDFAATLFSLLEPGGVAIVSTPYHGYFKNLCLALAGKMDAHFTALWDHGHIKFWSIRTLGMLLQEAGFVDIRFELVGRMPWLAKSMIAIAKRPE